MQTTEQLRLWVHGTVGVSWMMMVLLLVSFSNGCTPRTDLVDYQARTGFDVAAPTAGQAAVVFMRPERLAGMMSSTIFDGENLVAVLMDKTYVVHRTTPGQHRFMVLGEAADFMGADLEAGKVYFGLVTRRIGWVRWRFSLQPVTPNDPDWVKVREWITDSSRVTLNAAGRSWAQENAESIKDRHDAYLEKWLSKPEGERPMLYARDGVRAQDLP
jgi:hypothetical protein